MPNMEYRSVIKFFTWKSLNATEISKERDSVDDDDAPSYCTVAKWVAMFKEPERGFKDSPLTGRPSTITNDRNIQAVERVVMHNRQISVRRLAYEWPIPTTMTVHGIMSNYLGMTGGGKFQISICFEILIKMFSHSQRRSSGNFY